MRLLHTKSLELSPFYDNVPPYAILSHRWEDEEITFEDHTKDPISKRKSSSSAKRGFAKVSGVCALTVKDEFEWI